MSRLWTLWLLAGLLGCRSDESVALDFLKSSGMHDVALEPTGDEGAFRYTARFGTSSCQGRLEVIKARRGSTHVNDAVICRPHESLCLARRSGEACFRLGLIHDSGDTDPLSPVLRDPARAASFFSIGCDVGQPRACNALGLKHIEGDGVAADLTRAAALFERSCDGKHMKGCVNLALSYEHGRGVVEDRARAAALYDRACRSGLASGCDGQKRLADRVN